MYNPSDVPWVVQIQEGLTKKILTVASHLNWEHKGTLSKWYMGELLYWLASLVFVRVYFIPFTHRTIDWDLRKSVPNDRSWLMAFTFPRLNGCLFLEEIKRRVDSWQFTWTQVTYHFVLSNPSSPSSRQTRHVHRMKFPSFWWAHFVGFDNDLTSSLITLEEGLQILKSSFRLDRLGCYAKLRSLIRGQRVIVNHS